MQRVVHFEMHSADRQKTMKLYEAVFGWTFNPFGGPIESYLANTRDEKARGINGRRMPSRESQPRVVNTIQVQSGNRAVAKIAAHGGQIVAPKLAIPGSGYVAYLIHPAGSLQGVHHHEESAN